MSYLVVNEELRIQSCSIKDLDQEVKDTFVKQFNGEDIKTLTLFYNPESDTVVLNQDNRDYEFYKIAADAYLPADPEKRKLIREQTKEITKHSFDDTFNLLENVIEKRRRLPYDNEAKALMPILGKQPIDLYDKNYDILQAFRRTKGSLRSKYFFDYYPFIYGYIQGIRAERARRKKVAL